MNISHSFSNYERGLVIASARALLVAASIPGICDQLLGTLMREFLLDLRSASHAQPRLCEFGMCNAIALATTVIVMAEGYVSEFDTAI